MMQWLYTNKSLVAVVAVIASLLAIVFFRPGFKDPAEEQLGQTSFWEIRSIDTMKESRDRAREKSHDDSYDAVIEDLVAKIAATGATHVAVATPYDNEFIFFQKKWIASARRHNLNVWFRGNLSGWEGWFDYPKISREEHTQKIEEYILTHPELFESGDIFSSCPECENGGKGDPRRNGDLAGHRKFLINEYLVLKKAFDKIGDDVDARFFPMNGDVAKLVMNKETTKSLGGVVVVDHYVATPEKLVSDLQELKMLSGGEIVLGEFGAPIPDIHGKMSDEQQDAWIKKALDLLASTKVAKGVNYWVATGGSTELWNSKDVSPKKAVRTVNNFFYPHVATGIITDEFNRPLKNVRVLSPYSEVYTNRYGQFMLPITESTAINVSLDGYDKAAAILNVSDENGKVIKITRHNQKFSDKILKFFRDLGR
jgi:hypothetical protein